MKRILFFMSLMCIALSSYAKPATIEGVLKMYYIDVYGDGKVVNTYQETDWYNTYLAFVIEPSKPFDVRPYVSASELENVPPMQRQFMIYPNFKNLTARAFAQKYANKRVRVTGTLYVPGGGWRNMTEVVMDMTKIELVK